MIQDSSFNEVHTRKQSNSKTSNNKPLIFTNKESGTHFTQTF